MTGATSGRPDLGWPPRQISTGDGIETYPQPLASGKQVAVLYFDAEQPHRSVSSRWTAASARVIFPTLAKDFPEGRARDAGQIVVLKSPDGVEIHNQLFLPKDLKAGERRPALDLRARRPARQMLPGYHYMQFYHWAYAVNQWLANQGYVVLSVNYRSGIGYGRSFRQAPNTNARGNSEYQDVLAAGKYLQTRLTSTRRASASGVFRTADCSRRRHSRATRTSSWPAWTWRAFTSTAARSTRPRLVQVVRHLG